MNANNDANDNDERRSDSFEEIALDELMVPVNIEYVRYTSQKHDVYKFYRRLKNAIKTKTGGTKQMLCTLCLKGLQGTNCDEHSWKIALKKEESNTSNLMKHLKTKHKEDEEVKALLKPASDKKRKIMDSVDSSSSTVTITSMFPRVDSMSALRPRIAKWLLLDGRPFNIIDSPNFKDMMAPVVKDYSTMSRTTFNDYIGFEIDRFRKTVSSMVRAASENVFGERFIHVMHDMWTGADHNNYLGFSISFIHDFSLVKVFLGLEKNNVSHHADYNAVLLEYSFLRNYDFDFAPWCRTVVSDTTPSATNVASQLSEDAEQINCEMHELNSCLKYGYGILENTRTKYARNEDGTFAYNDQNQRFKVTTVTTPGGEFSEGKRIISALQDIAKYFGTPQRKERFKTCQTYNNYPTGTPSYNGDTRVSSIHTLMYSCLFHYFAMKKFADTNEDDEDEDFEFSRIWNRLSDGDWDSVQEMESATNHVAKYATCESQLTSVTASFTEFLRMKALDLLDAPQFKVFKYTQRPKSTDKRKDGMVLKSQMRETKDTADFSEHGMQCLRRTRLQIQKRFKPQTKEDALIIFLDPRVACQATSMIDPNIYDEAVTYFKSELKRMKELIVVEPPDTSQEHAPDDVDDVDEDDVDEGDVLLTSTEPLLNECPIDSLYETWITTCSRIKWVDYMQDRDRAPKKEFRTILDLLRYCDALKWFRTSTEAKIPSLQPILTLASIHLAKCDSSSFQESAFSSSKNNMNSFQTCMDSERFGDRSVIYHNRKFIRRYIHGATFN